MPGVGAGPLPGVVSGPLPGAVAGPFPGVGAGCPFGSWNFISFANGKCGIKNLKNNIYLEVRLVHIEMICTQSWLKHII